MRRYAALVIGVALLALVGYAGYALYPRFDLPALEGVSLLLLAVAAGIASFFSPCSFSLMVALLGREASSGDGDGAIGRGLVFAGALAVGASAFLLISGIVLALGGSALFASVTFPSIAGRLIRLITGTVLILLGLMQLGWLANWVGRIGALASPLMRWQARARRQHPAAGFAVLGFAYPLAGFG